MPKVPLDSIFPNFHWNRRTLLLLSLNALFTYLSEIFIGFIYFYFILFFYFPHISLDSTLFRSFFEFPRKFPRILSQVRLIISFKFMLCIQRSFLKHERLSLFTFSNF